ncbi:hypothetical protein [Paenibacillus sp. DYY-L-2]|uniref:hypothetical protein n=1 Tax=Paenibacillus sp. DYY-L-2 TaxID=3447013 RepID=UPI003F4FA7C6
MSAIAKWQPVKSGAPKQSNMSQIPVERYFGPAGSITFEELVQSMIEEHVEKYANSSYHDERVNAAIPVEGGSRQ